MRVAVIGRGVSGLTTAHELLDAGHDVAVIGAEPPLSTTSAVAAAVWYPYRAFPHDRVTAWGAVALERFRSLASDPATGVIMRDGVEFVRDDEVPWWSKDVVEVRRGERELPPWAHAAWEFRAPVIEMPIFLAWLEERLANMGAAIEQARVARLTDIERADVIVDCAGLGARELVPDHSLFPVRGQVVIVADPGLDSFTLDQNSPEGITYIVPRSNDCVLGGTDDEGSWDLTPDEEVARDIIRRCARLEPRLEGARVTGHKVGLRPARPTVRLERDISADGRLVIHNYGHGGAGVTLSWGCAAEVASLMAAGG